MSATIKDLDQELAWLDRQHIDLQIARESLGDLGWSAPTSWAVVKREAQALYPLQRPLLRQMWLRLDGTSRTSIAKTTIGITFMELARMECVRALELAGERT